MKKRNIQVGKYTYGHDFIKLNTWAGPPAGVIIGNFCSIAGGCEIFLNANHHIEYVTTFPFGDKHLDVFPASKINNQSSGGVFIGNDVWIGADVTIMGGVTIGDGAVVAANSHVVKNVEPYSVVGGNPAKHIKYRFDPETIAKLLQIKWWDWPVDKINRLMSKLRSPNIADFIAAAEQQ